MAFKLSIFIFITKATSYSKTNACSCECMMYLTHMHVYGVSMCGHVICMFMVYQRENWKDTLISILEAKNKQNIETKIYTHKTNSEKRHVTSRTRKQKQTKLGLGFLGISMRAHT